MAEHYDHSQLEKVAYELDLRASAGELMKYAVLNLPRESDTDLNYGISRVPLLRHPLYACLGLRPVLAQHTSAEHAAFKRWATDRRSIVEIGVAYPQTELRGESDRAPATQTRP